MNDPAFTEDPRIAEAEMLARQILQTHPDHADARNALGLVLLEKADWDEAALEFRRALAEDDGRADIIHNCVRAALGQARSALSDGLVDDALAALQSTLRISPNRLEVICQISFVLSEGGRFNEALAAADKGLSIDPEAAHPHDVRGLALMGLGRLDDTIKCFRRALIIDREYVAAMINFGNALQAKGDYEDAITCFDEAIYFEPGNCLAFNNLGLACAAQGKFDEAEQALRQAVAVDPTFPEAHFNLSRILLMQGNYADGWRENEWRWRCKDFPSTWRDFPYPLWQGEPLDGKTILLWSEQGIGDEIMFANPIPDLLATGAHLVMECGERLVPIFERSFEGAVVVARHDPPDGKIALADVDFQAPFGSLCLHFRTSKDDFTNYDGHYLLADPERTAELRDRYQSFGPGPVIGICWRSGNPVVGEERSVPLAWWDSILSHGPCQFISLQYGDVDEDLAEVWSRTGVTIHRDSEVDPFASAEDWFAQVAAMDLVISVDNSTIQVSGSLGVPTWNLLSHLPEWRFGLEGEDHDWHPYVRVFRQAEPGDWGPVVTRISEELAAWLALKGSI